VFLQGLLIPDPDPTWTKSYRYSLSKMERMMFNFKENDLTGGFCPYKLLQMHFQMNFLPDVCVFSSFYGTVSRDGFGF
jgi:hypothetical protein